MMKYYKLLAGGVVTVMALPLTAAGHSGRTASDFPGLKVVSEWQNGIPEGGKRKVKSSAPSAKAPSYQNMRINGFLMYDDQKSEDVLGFYEYSITAPVQRRPLVNVSRQYVGGDAVVKNGKLYTCHIDMQYGYINSAFYTVIDVATGTATKGSNISYDVAVAMEHAATSAALNKTTGEVYCSGYTYNAEDKSLTPTLKIWDVENNSKTTIGTMEASLAVMVFNAAGDLYGITASSSKGSDDGGRLVKVNTETGKLTLIGDTGVRPWFDQSGTYYDGTGAFFWFANEPMAGDENAAKSTLYTVDLETAAVTAVGDLPNGDEVVAAWIPEQTIDDGAPSIVKNLSTSFEGASLTGNVNFELPDDTYSGEPLSGEIDWVVKSGETVMASGKGNASETVEAPVSVEKSGKYTFSITVSNGSGAGLISEVTTYIGYGVPKAATDVTFAINGDKNVVSWTHSTGVDGEGYMEGDHPSYKIVRQPGNVVLEEKFDGNSYEENALTGSLKSTYYEITSVNGDMEGVVAKSNALITGESLELPYSEDFTDAASFDLYFPIDANKDNNTWYYSVKSAKIRQATSQNDWLILPPVKLESGYSYEFKFNCYGTQVTNVNLLDVAMGLTPTEMTIPLLSDVEVKDTKSTAMKEVSVLIKPEETATYRLGILLKTDSRQGTFTVDDISISEGKSTAIPAAPEFSVEAGDKGELSAKLTISVPTLTAGGAALTNRPGQFEIERNGTALATVDTNDSDSEYTYNDDNVAEAGTYTYTVRAINADGKGEDAVKSVYIGTDSPLAPTGFVAKDNFDGTVTLSWDEPSSVGANGGYVDTDNLRYTITHPDGTTIAGISEKSKIVDHEITGAQKEVNYSLAVHYADAEPLATHTVTSNTLIAGEAYRGSFSETFPVSDGVVTPSTSVWTKEVVSGKSSQFSIAMRSDDHTGDGSGCLHFTGYAADASGRWISPVIDLSDVENPEVTMWVKTADNNSSFKLQVSKEYGDWETIASPDDATDWTELKASLAEYRSKHVRLGFLANSHSNMNFTYADDINVHNAVASGIATVISNDGVEEIYTLQGIRVTGRPAPGVYIIRKGDKTRKVIIK